MIPEHGPSLEPRPVRVSANALQVIVRNDCWACGESFTKTVLLEGVGRQELHWHCDACEVSWTAPGLVLPAGDFLIARL